MGLPASTGGDGRGMRRYWRSGCIPIGAMLAAPFLALVFSLEAGLGLTTVSLLLAAGLSVDGSRQADPPRDRQLRLMAVVDVLLALLCGAVLWSRLAG